VAARRPVDHRGHIDAAVAGGVESISLTLTKHMSTYRNRSQAVIAAEPHAYMAMIETAEIVADAYGVTREAQECLLRPQPAARPPPRRQPAASPTRSCRSPSTRRCSTRKATKTGKHSVTLDRDEGGFAATPTVEGLAALKRSSRMARSSRKAATSPPATPASFPDGASAQVVVDRALAEKEGLPILGIYRGFQVAGCAPEEMGIGPIFAVPKLLDRAGLKVSDIGLLGKSTRPSHRRRSTASRRWRSIRIA